MSAPLAPKELVALEDGHRESAESWSDLLRSCKRRGMRAAVLAVGDGALGVLDRAARRVTKGPGSRAAGLTLGRPSRTFNEFVKRGSAVAGTDQLSVVFSALADPTRRAILDELAERDATVTELSAPLPMSMPAVSRHLKVLEHAALISRTRSGKWRASHLETAPLREAAGWIDRFRQFWDSSLDRLDAHLAAVQAAERSDTKEP